MKRLVAFFLAILCVMFALAGCGEPKPQVFTINVVNMQDDGSVGTVEATDENGNKIILPDDWNTWFEDGTIKKLYCNGLQIAPSGKGIIASDSGIDGTVKVGDTQYTFNIAVGKQFSYKKVNDQIKLVINDQFTPVQ